MIRILAAAALLASLTTPASAEPISLILTTVLAAAGVPTAVSFFGITINAAALAASVITAGIGLALAYAFRPKPPKPEQERGAFVTQQPIPFAFGAYGRTRLAGAMMLKEAVSGHLCYCAALTRHKLNEIKQIYFNDDPITLGGSDASITGPVGGLVQAGEGDRYSQLILVDTRYGEPTETAHGLLTTYASSLWTSDHKGNGISSLAYVAKPVSPGDFTKIYPYGAPQPSVDAEWRLVYDPRDPDQDPDDESTWEYSANSVLCILDYLCFNPLGMRRSYSSTVLPVLPRWIRAIDDCDFVVNKLVGTEPRYECHGFFQGNTEHRTVLENLLATCDGWMSERGDGTVVIDVGVWREPEVTLTDTDIAGFQIFHGTASEERINQSTARWVSPDHAYAPIETPPLIDSADQAARRGPARAVQYDFEFVHSIGQVSRLHKVQFNRHRSGFHGQLFLWWSGLDACYSRRVKVLSNQIAALNGKYLEITKPVISLEKMVATVDFIIVAADLYDYTPATDEQDVPPVPTRPGANTPPQPSNFNATPSQLSGDDGTINFYVALTFDTPQLYGADRTDLTYTARWRLEDAGGGSPGPWTETQFTSPSNSGGTTTLNLFGVPTGTSIDIEVQSVLTNGVKSEWSLTETVSTSISDAAPGPPTGLTTTGGTGQVLLEATAPNSANFRYIRFFRAADGDPFGSAVPIGTDIYGSPNSVLSYTDVVSTGTYDYFAVAYSTFGTASTAAGPEEGISS